ncbi:Uncharacterised protein [Mycobacteroides abscessus subsp. abscessus]|nr:Uncharacterised protein [Mycobacteroides abscessus subsp. abscessus]
MCLNFANQSLLTQLHFGFFSKITLGKTQLVQMLNDFKQVIHVHVFGRSLASDMLKHVTVSILIQIQRFFSHVNGS